MSVLTVLSVEQSLVSVKLEKTFIFVGTSWLPYYMYENVERT